MPTRRRVSWSISIGIASFGTERHPGRRLCPAGPEFISGDQVGPGRRRRPAELTPLSRIAGRACPWEQTLTLATIHQD
jgi:hypothetical protein